MGVPASSSTWAARREVAVAARRALVEAGGLELPLLLVRALEELRLTPSAFAERLIEGSVWQDQAIRSTDGRVSIEAHLWRDGLRCAVRIGDAWFHHPAGVLHLWHIQLPATVLALRSVPASVILADPLFDDERIQARSLDWLNASDPDMGVGMRLLMPSEPVR